MAADFVSISLSQHELWRQQWSVCCERSAPKDNQTVIMQPVAVPAIPVEELKDITDNFGLEALIGEGSYGRVYHGVLNGGQNAAIKKLLQKKQPDQEFLQRYYKSSLCS